MLERLERENLFVVALDDERRWYRYHHLFADFLNGRLKRERPERVKELHLRAASWYRRNGWGSEAVEHALAAGEAEFAARLVEDNAQALFQRGEGATVDRWLAALPAGLIRSRPRLSLARAIWALIGGRVDEVEPLLTDAERALATIDQGDGPPAAEATRGLPTFPGRSRFCAPSSPVSAATSNTRSSSHNWHAPARTRVTDIYASSPAGTWRWRSRCKAGLGKPRSRSPSLSPTRGQADCTATSPCAPTTPSGRSSVLRAA